MARSGYLRDAQLQMPLGTHYGNLLAVFSSKQIREGLMIQFVCDTCVAIKEPSEVWIVGLAAESVGVTSARREVTIQPAWDRPTSVHPLAVHFCSVECKDNYMARLFASDAAAEEVVVERSVPEEVVVTTAPIVEVRTPRTNVRRKRA
jgi:hypothetical protein